MRRRFRLPVFLLIVSAVSAAGYMSITALDNDAQGSLRAQVTGGPVFLMGSTVTVEPSRPAFVFCPQSSRAVPISVPQGTVQMYEFAGYEWAVAITQPTAPQAFLFPGRNLTLVNNAHPDSTAAGITEIQPGKLYYITSTVPLTINCAAGTMNDTGSVRMESTPATTGNGAAMTEESAGTMGNGTTKTGNSATVVGTCPSGFTCLTNGKNRVAWECGTTSNTRTETSVQCGTVADPGVCARCVSVSASSTAAVKQAPKTCPKISCAQPKPSCFWSKGTDANGCPTCGRMVCPIE